MDRREYITKFIDRTQLGIEIAPWFAPLASQKDGYRSRSLDIFNTDELRRRGADYKVSEENISLIEDVEFVGSATNIADIVMAKYPPASFDYIISAHNFEHLPNPIRFFQGCQKVLKPGGVVSMLMPDRRTCWDYFRPNSTLADLLEAYFEKRERPSPTQIFEQFSLHCVFINDQGTQDLGFSINDDLARLKPLETLSEAYKAWESFVANPDDVYHDVHCWVFTPASLQLMLHDLKFLGVLNFDIIEVCEINESREFCIHLRNCLPDEAKPLSSKEFYEQRRDLLFRVHAEAAVNLVPRHAQPDSDSRLAKENEKLKNDIMALKTSTSWKITAPLRALRSFCGD